MNNWNFTGNIGNPAEQRYSPNNDSIVSFSVAVKSGFGDKAKTTWARCTMWGKRGESVLPYLIKGQQVAISGEATLNEYVNKDGVTKASVEVRVNDLTLLGKKAEAGQSDPAPAKSSPSRSPSPAPSSGFDDMDSDIPF